MKRLLLLDGHSLAYRAFYALPVENFSTSTGQPTNGVYGFTSMLINVLRDEEPTHIGVCFDVSRQTFRAEEYAEYKAGRAKTPDEFKGQVSLVHEILDALKIRYIELAGWEADDLIATLSTQAEDQGFDEVLIVSGDRDAMQLVTDKVTVLYPAKGVSDLWRMTPAKVEERYLVSPERYPDLAALVGEKSDNLPGVPGVGAKTAAKWLALYGDLPGIVDHVGEIKGKVGDSLREHLDGVLRNRRLNQLVRDVSLDVTVDDLERQVWDRDQVHQVFDGLEFRVLRERLFATLDAAGDEAEGVVEVEGSVLAPEEVAGWVADNLTSKERAGLHVIGDWSRGTGDVRAIAVAVGDGEAARAAYFDVAELTQAADKVVREWLADPERPKVMHDAKGPLQALYAAGLPLAGLVSDTALAAYLVRPDQRAYDLADLVLRFLRRELRPEQDNPAQGMLDLDGHDHQGEEAMVQARAVLDLSTALDEQVAETGGTELLAEMELPLVDLLAQMERVGIHVDPELLERLESDYADALDRAAEDAYEAAEGERINLGSPKQLQVLLFDKLGMPKTKKTKTGYTTDADALTDLYAKTEHPFLEALLRHRDSARLRVTVEGLTKSIADDGRIHTTYQQTIAATGRLSSTDPNLQNIPIRTEEGRRIREAFVVGDGFESLMSADYSQIEMRIMAHLSGDEGLIEAFRSGEDLHRFVGSRVFAVEPQDVTAEMRAKVKAMSYGLAYGLSAYGLSKQLAISAGEATTLMEEYFTRFGGVRDYLREVVDVARKTGYTETMLGRRRYLPDLTSDNRQRRQAAERMALNAPIQGSAADVMKLAMLHVRAALDTADVKSRMLLQVHDELVIEIAPGEQATVEEIVRREMGAAIELDVPLDVSIGVGNSWHAAAH
ncbi:DNA polymerase I [Flexivirga endophytica]|uniref:DNA polymerase I n=1 Tax=Flexivirga endophytica TaxID=1849103 RepID=A0A916T828_9MICO|nr:DNA polymerase I [Flexivirga endophytica]GGB33483.1 DNA polymerase I [Flexivirga endophytica]GHB41491.1 DNA polymerase I [Flexivirga endophytica]